MSQYDDEILGEPLDLPEQQNDYKQPSKTKKTRPARNWKKPLVIVGVVLLLAGGGFAVWTLLDNDESDEAATQEQPITDEETAAAENVLDPSDDVPEATDTETTRTSAPRMEVTYPTTWTLTEGDDDVTVESPAFSFATRAGEQIDNGVFRLYFRQGARDADSTYIGQGVAALPSQQISYTDPALGQREDTNLSFFGMNETNHLAFFFVAGNFTLEPGDTLGPDYGQEAETYIIAGGYSSPALEDDLEMHQVPIDYFQSTRAYEQAIGIIESLQLL